MYFCFRDVGFSLWTTFCLNTCNYDRVMAIKVNFQNGGRRHLGFFGFEIWRQRKSVAASPYLPPHQIWWRYLKGRPSYRSLCVFKMVAAAILNYYLAILDHPRSLLVDRKLVLKFRVDRIYTCICEDISDRTFRKFGLKSLFPPPPKIYVLGEFWPLNINFHQRDPQKALPWRKTRAMSHRASKSVQRCGQDAVRRIQKNKG